MIVLNLWFIFHIIITNSHLVSHRMTWVFKENSVAIGGYKITILSL